MSSSYRTPEVFTEAEHILPSPELPGSTINPALVTRVVHVRGYLDVMIHSEPLVQVLFLGHKPARATPQMSIDAMSVVITTYG